MTQVSFIVGIGVDKVGRIIPAYVAEQEIHHFADELSRKFGGCSVIRQARIRPDEREKHEFIHEPSVRFDVLIAAPKTAKKGIQLSAEHIRQRFNQSAVTVISSSVGVEFI